MTEPTDTNQASEDELKKPSERKKLFNRLVFMFSWKGETRRTKANKMMKIIDQYTETIIRTEKLKLLSEIEKELPTQTVITEEDTGIDLARKSAANNVLTTVKSLITTKRGEV